MRLYYLIFLIFLNISTILSSSKMIDYTKGKLQSTENDVVCVACIGVMEAVSVAFYSEAVVLWAAGVICRLISKQPSIVCNGITGQFKDEAIYVFSKLTRYSPSTACSIVLPQCTDDTDPSGAAWEVVLPPLPKLSARRKLKESRASRYSSSNSNGNLRVLHLTDLHVDFEYLPGSEAACTMPVCCRENSTSISQKAGYWGTAASCDIPPWTLRNMLQHINQTHTIDMVLLTGDLINHVDWQYSIEDHLEVLQKLHSMIIEYFPTTLTYWSLGNHEGVPVNSFAPHTVDERFWPVWLYSQMSNMSAPWVKSNLTDRQISKMGSYSTVVAPGLRLVSLNTGFCETTNFFLYLNQSDPDGTMSWLVNELYQAEKVGDAVQIMAHIPPGDGECLEGWARNYYRVIQRFSNTITAQYFGHDHRDFFLVFYEDMHNVNSRPISVGYAAPSATTYTGLNPAYRIYTLDASNHYTPSDFEVYTTDLYKYPTSNDLPQWRMLYSAKEEYDLPDLSPTSWNKLIQKIFTDTSTRNVFIRNSFRTATPICDSSCIRSLMCSLRMGHHNETLYCPPSLEDYLLTNRVPTF